MIKCPNCKAELLIEHSFCPVCAFDLRIRKNSVLSEDDVVSKEVPEITVSPELTPPPIPESDIQTEVNLSDSESQKQGILSRPFSFDGRIRRLEYGISTIIFVLVSRLVGFTLQEMIKSGSLDYSNAMNLLYLSFIPLFWFFWAQGAKRCHDLGKSGWWQIIPFYGFWLLFQNGQQGFNEYGRNPKS